jgi:GntR family transcriptional repressor for pyruvate dehydrogenase complex
MKFGQQFKPERKRLHEQVADHLWQGIVESNLQPGDVIPSERELAEQMGVSRATISNAIRLLEQQGLVSIQVGSGTYVTNKAQSAFVDAMERLFSLQDCTAQELMTFREMIEPDIAALAASHATPDDLAALGRYLEETEETWYAGDAEKNVTADARFHEALAKATGNQLLIAITAGIQRLLLRTLDAQYQVERDETREQGILSHRPVFEAILKKDSKAAQAAMNEHMRRTRLALEEAVARGLVTKDSEER